MPLIPGSASHAPPPGWHRGTAADEEPAWACLMAESWKGDPPPLATDFSRSSHTHTHPHTHAFSLPLSTLILIGHEVRGGAERRCGSRQPVTRGAPTITSLIGSTWRRARVVCVWHPGPPSPGISALAWRACQCNLRGLGGWWGRRGKPAAWSAANVILACRTRLVPRISGGA